MNWLNVFIWLIVMPFGGLLSWGLIIYLIFRLIEV